MTPIMIFCSQIKIEEKQIKLERDFGWKVEFKLKQVCICMDT